MSATTGDRPATSAGPAARTTSRVVAALTTAVVALVGCFLIVLALAGSGL